MLLLDYFHIWKEAFYQPSRRFPNPRALVRVIAAKLPPLAPLLQTAFVVFSSLLKPLLSPFHTFGLIFPQGRNYSALMSPINAHLTDARLAKLRVLMKSASVDALYIPSADAHSNEYISPSDARRAYISGFTGSAGTVALHRWLLM